MTVAFRENLKFPQSFIGSHLGSISFCLWTVVNQQQPIKPSWGQVVSCAHGQPKWIKQTLAYNNMISYKVTQRYAANMILVIEAYSFSAFRSPRNGQCVHSCGICNSIEFHSLILSVMPETLSSINNLKESIHFIQTYKVALIKTPH